MKKRPAPKTPRPPSAPKLPRAISQLLTRRKPHTHQARPRAIPPLLTRRNHRTHANTVPMSETMTVSAGDEHREHDRPAKVVERTWYYDRDEECEERRAPECERDHDRDDECDGGKGGHHGPPGRPGRPTRPPGVSTGRLGQGGPLTTGDINAPNIPGVWVGPRADMDLPYLFMRANPADLGARAIVGAPFWESPDIFILAGVTPALAPPLPPALGQVALAGQPNTIYAHVWNFGKAEASEVVVEFYWVDPALGINPGSVHLISQTFTALGAKGSGRSHTVVKCPDAWTPTYVNGGHECLLVRVWDNTSDLPGEPKFDASINRHVAQRNIHVVAPGGPLLKPFLEAKVVGAPGAAPLLKPLLGGAPPPALSQPLLLKVGPLYGAPAQVAVERVSPNSVPWLQLHTGKRGVFPAMAPPTGVPILSPPTTAGGGFPSTGGAAQQHVHGDDQQVAFTTSDDAPGPGEAHVYRVSATQAGATFGGYTIVILG